MDKNGRVRLFYQIMKEAFGKKTVTLLIANLESIGFFDAPASTKYHGSYPGGLFDHSFAVTKTLLSLTERLELKWKRPQSPYLIGMLHDLCKCDNYIRKPDGHTVHDYDKRFQAEDEGRVPTDRKFRWKMLKEDEP